MNHEDLQMWCFDRSAVPKFEKVVQGHCALDGLAAIHSLVVDFCDQILLAWLF